MNCRVCQKEHFRFSELCFECSEIKKNIRIKTRNATKKLIRLGVIKCPSNCQYCDKNDKTIHVHHLDYEDPEKILFLCSSCHHRLHTGRNIHLRVSDIRLKCQTALHLGCN